VFADAVPAWTIVVSAVGLSVMVPPDAAGVAGAGVGVAVVFGVGVGVGAGGATTVSVVVARVDPFDTRRAAIVWGPGVTAGTVIVRVNDPLLEASKLGIPVVDPSKASWRRSRVLKPEPPTEMVAPAGALLGLTDRAGVAAIAAGIVVIAREARSARRRSDRQRRSDRADRTARAARWAGRRGGRGMPVSFSGSPEGFGDVEALDGGAVW
jgi:hypothetical protein